ncbi:alpha/beta hydrolase [Flammeovirga sp. OC4]|uniref:alpha/beta hydrolase n=1 Tax=Flammeovirga sp. OC4 TaxID=1382345 RepID=UPI00069498AA|nr:alpha/beta hydrolase [Flammeovirga sp. OC4]
MEHHQQWVPLQVEAPFYTNGTVTNKTEHLWMVLHGYGQLADHFMRRFDILNTDRHHVVGCQGLSRFYLDKQYQKVGASWMTKLDREADIRHQQEYLSNVFENRLSELGDQKDHLKFNYLAFSQGGATLLRWLKYYKPKVDNLILWAADMPKEFTLDDYSFLSPDSTVFIVLGDRDPFRTFIDIKKQKELLNSLNCNSKFINFDGGHHVRRDVLEECVKHFDDKF